jgi:hypothetical protein
MTHAHSCSNHGFFLIKTTIGTIKTQLIQLNNTNAVGTKHSTDWDKEVGRSQTNKQSKRNVATIAKYYCLEATEARTVEEKVACTQRRKHTAAAAHTSQHRCAP